MKYNRYMFVWGLLLAGMTTVNAQSQEKTAKAEKNFYTMERIKADNPWAESANFAGLIFNEAEDFSVVKARFEYEEGNFRNVSDPVGRNLFNLQTESFRRLNKVYFYGKLQFDYSNRRKMGWAGVLNPYDSPIWITDSTPASQRLEMYRLDGGVGYRLGQHFAIGARVAYDVAENAKQKDARNRNRYMNMRVYPGLLWHGSFLRGGATFIYGKKTEKVDIGIMGTGNVHKIYDFNGLWYYTYTHMQDGNNLLRDYKNEILGGSLQLEFYGKKWRFFNQLEFTNREQDVFCSAMGDEKGGEMKERNYDYTGALVRRGDRYNHYLHLVGNFSDQLGYENIQQKEVVDGNSVWVEYGRKNRTTVENIRGDVYYSLVRNRSAYNASWNAVIGARGFSMERAYRIYPLKYTQEIRNIEGYLSFNKNFLFKKGMFDCRLKGAYGVGSGTMLEEEKEADTGNPDVSEYLQQTDLLLAEYEYFTADRFSLGLDARYTWFLQPEKGYSLYADVRTDYKKAVSGLYKGKERAEIRLVVGFAF